jgi:hypothetical protein
MQPTRQSSADVLAAFIEFEEREQLFDQRLLGVAYWQLIRHDVFRETLQALGLAERAHLRVEELPLRHWLGPQLRQLPTTLGRSFFTRLPRAELLVAAHPRQLAYEGRFICPYSQPLLWGTQRSRLLLEGHFQGRYFSPDAGEPTRYVDLALVLAHAAFRARELRGHGLSARDRGALAELTQRLGLQLGAAPEPAAVLRRARTAVLATLGLRAPLSYLLDRVQPKLIVEVVGYRLVNQVLTLLAHERGIPVAELQHGTMGAAHAGYNFARGRLPDAFPDYLLLFGELWRSATPGLPLDPAHTPAVGYGWLELQRAQHARHSQRGVRRILFLSQRDVGRALSRVACALQAQLPAGAFELAYRLHPSEAIRWREHYPELSQSGMRVELAEERGLYASQCAADVQVGVYSTALLEGVAFGLDTYLVQLSGHEQLSMLTAAGIARLVAGADELAAALQRAPNASATAAASDALWASDARRNFSRFVESVIGSRAF